MLAMEIGPAAMSQVVPGNESHLVLNEGNANSNFLTEFVAYYLNLPSGIVSGPYDHKTLGSLSACEFQSYPYATISNLSCKSYKTWRLQKAAALQAEC